MSYRYKSFFIFILELCILCGCSKTKEEKSEEMKTQEATIMKNDSLKRIDSLKSDVFFIDKKKVQEIEDSNKIKPLAKLDEGRSVNLNGVAYFVKGGDVLVKPDELVNYAKEKALLDMMLKDKMKIFLIGDLDPSGAPERWPPGYVIKYSVLKRSFSEPTNYEFVIRNINEASIEWQNTCGVKFAYDPQFDNNSNMDIVPADVDFVVEETQMHDQFVAASFQPSQEKQRHFLFVDYSYYNCIYDKVGVFRHELGHILGFKHEHIRSGAPELCPGESPGYVNPLTQYDPKSVMHYFCGGVGDRELKLTNFDIEGSQRLYGPPLK